MSNDIKEINIVKSFLDTLSEKHIELLKNVISELQKEKEPAHIPGRYKGENFWRYNWATKRVGTQEQDTDFFRHIGECSKTEEEADFIYRQQKAYLELIDKIHELNDGWTPDFQSDHLSNYVFSYYTDINEINICGWSSIQYLKSELYFKDEKTGSKLIDELGEDLIKLALWGIE